MAYIQTISPGQAQGPLKRLYKEIRSEFPRIPNVMKAASLNPALSEAMFRSYQAMMTRGVLPRDWREVLAVAVSEANSCSYCVDAHTMMLDALGFDRRTTDHLRKAIQAERLEPRLRRLVALARKVTWEPGKVTAEDKEAWRSILINPAERAEATAIVAGFNYINRIADGLGVTREIPAPFWLFEGIGRSLLSFAGWITRSRVRLSLRRAQTPGIEEAAEEIERRASGPDSIHFSPEMFDALKGSPDVFVRMWNLTKQIVDESRLGDREKGAIALLVGELNDIGPLQDIRRMWIANQGIDYQAVVEASMSSAACSQEAGEFAPVGSETRRLTPRETAFLPLARKVTVEAFKITAGDIGRLRLVGMNDREALDVVCLAALHNSGDRLLALS